MLSLITLKMIPQMRTAIKMATSAHKIEFSSHAYFLPRRIHGNCVEILADISPNSTLATPTIAP